MPAFHIIGDKDTVLGYRFAGVTGDPVSSEQEARAAFQKALETREGVLLLTEKVEAMLTDLVTAHKLQAKPPYIAVVEDIWGHREGRRPLLETIYEAVGIRIVSDN